MKTAKLIAASFLISFFIFLNTSRAEVYQQVPVVINILSNSGANVANITNSIKLVNEYFKTNNWNVRFKVEKVHEDVTMGDDGDSNLTYAEGDAVVAAGRAELTNNFGGKGIKINVANTPWVSNTTPGWSVHRNPSFVIKDRITNSLTAQTIFHEFGHIVTLCGSYVLEGTNRANANGHAPSNDFSWGAKNFMAPSNWRHGVDVTSNQKAKVKTDGVLDGLSISVTNNPALTAAAVKRFLAFALFMRYYALANPYFFGSAMLRSTLEKQRIFGQLLLGGLFPQSSSAWVLYRLLFNADNSISTGPTIAGFPGIDRELRLSMLWEFGYPTLDAYVICYISGTTNVLPVTPEFHTAIRVAGSEQPSSNHNHVITFEVPKSMLLLTATEVPMGLVSQDARTLSILDSAPTIYYQEFWKMTPALVLQQNSAAPGELVPFEITGLKPRDSYTLFFEDSVFMSGALQPDGTATGTFVFPSVPLDTTYYITAQDSSGNFGFNVLTAIPEPGALLLIFSIVGIFRLKR